MSFREESVLITTVIPMVKTYMHLLALNGFANILNKINKIVPSEIIIKL